MRSPQPFAVARCAAALTAAASLLFASPAFAQVADAPVADARGGPESALDLWFVAERIELELPARDEEPMRIGRVAHLPDETLLVQDADTCEVHVFDGSGAHVRTLAPPREWPHEDRGEFGRLVGLHRDAIWWGREVSVLNRGLGYTGRKVHRFLSLTDGPSQAERPWLFDLEGEPSASTAHGLWSVLRGGVLFFDERLRPVHWARSRAGGVAVFPELDSLSVTESGAVWIVQGSPKRRSVVMRCASPPGPRRGYVTPPRPDHETLTRIEPDGRVAVASKRLRTPLRWLLASDERLLALPDAEPGRLTAPLVEIDFETMVERPTGLLLPAGTQESHVRLFREGTRVHCFESSTRSLVVLSRR